jgi:hypothetical protein
LRNLKAVLLCLLSASCSSDTGTKSASAPQVQQNTPASPAGAAAIQDARSATCPHTGKWALCSVENRLRQAGFVARKTEGKPVRRPGFSVEPVVYRLGSGRLEVFIYADEAAMERDVAKIDTLTVAPGGVASPWDGTPVLVRSGNLAAVLVTETQSQIERLTLALTAGAPQPGSPR